MHLSPKDIDKLVLHNAGFVAQKRFARGLRLNYPEAVALIATQLLEFIRDGESVATLMNKGKQILGLNNVMEGVAEMIAEVQVEGTFPDGTKLVTVHHPVCRQQGSPELALYASGLSYNSKTATPDNLINPNPGEYLLADAEVNLNEGCEVVEVEVTNMGDRPVQVGSHYPFFETNASLQFDREQAFGFRLNIPAGTAVRFEPGERKRVQLVALAGERIVYGGNSLISGQLDGPHKADAMVKVKNNNFLHNS
ncbi:urease subunit beta [Pontibacter silvestris]|uniref:Urease subunit beta n=1 Tax=Pontibacter silvestris TaxID=2305183 RepID=A0ABW4WYB9_9BACT|nr:urease subunit beta [Pontibacter silvestris]MCC9135255.1 urease subunit beta [Pontibacter silvestris]